MNDRQSRARVAARDGRGGDIRQNTEGRKHTSFHALVAQHERHSTWRYVLAGSSTALYLVATSPVTRDEALASLAQHYGCNRVLSLKPGGVE